MKFKEKESVPCEGLVLGRLWLAGRGLFLWSHKELTGLPIHRQGIFKNLLCDCACIRLGQFQMPYFNNSKILILPHILISLKLGYILKLLSF